MTRDLQKEEEFYAKDFNFSYSSMNKLIFSPSLFYKDYILEEREIKTDKHLIEGKLIHCLLLEPDQFENKFALVPGKTPSDNVRKVLTSLKNDSKNRGLEDLGPAILLVLKEHNLYQSLKEDSKRLEKIQTPDNIEYFKFLQESDKDVIDQDTYAKCQKHVEILKSNETVSELFKNDETDFELSSEDRYVERYLQCSLQGSTQFGLHGYVDFYKVDHETKTVTICDLKTTGKTISDFGETVDFYNYWLQAAIYVKLVYENLKEEEKDYNILFKFVVIDKYNQVYVFDVTESTMGNWAQGLTETLYRAEFHYNSKDYSLPYEFLTKKQRL